MPPFSSFFVNLFSTPCSVIFCRRSLQWWCQSLSPGPNRPVLVHNYPFLFVQSAGIQCLHPYFSQLQSQSKPCLLLPSLSLSSLNLALSISLSSLSHPHTLGDTGSVYVYKKVAKKVHPIPASLTKDFCVLRWFPSDLLVTLPTLSMNLSNFASDIWLTQKHLDMLRLNQDNFLWPDELKLWHHVLKINKLGLAWNEQKKGHFHNNYFSLVLEIFSQYWP